MVFSDFGDVERSFRFGTVRSSVCAGIRLMLPIFNQAPIAIDFAAPLSSSRQDDRQFISFGFSFQQ